MLMFLPIYHREALYGLIRETYVFNVTILISNSHTNGNIKKTPSGPPFHTQGEI